MISDIFCIFVVEIQLVTNIKRYHYGEYQGQSYRIILYYWWILIRLCSHSAIPIRFTPTLILRIWERAFAASSIELSQLLDNPIENCVRPLAIGRKNYMFCENHNAAEEAAIMYTMMGCCKLADVDFRKCTTYFLQHIHEYDDDYSKDLTDFFPHILKKKGLVWYFLKN